MMKRTELRWKCGEQSSTSQHTSACEPTRCLYSISRRRPIAASDQVASLLRYRVSLNFLVTFRLHDKRGVLTWHALSKISSSPFEFASKPMFVLRNFHEWRSVNQCQQSFLELLHSSGPTLLPGATPSPWQKKLHLLAQGPEYWGLGLPSSTSFSRRMDHHSQGLLLRETPSEVTVTVFQIEQFHHLTPNKTEAKALV